MTALRPPRAQFAHRRTVRLIVDETMDLDSIQVAKSLPDFAEEICGIVPQFGGKCFDITLNTPDTALKLAQSGFDYEHVRKPLRLLSSKSIHVSVFVSVEYPDEDLLNLLAKYGDLKSRNIRRLYFQEEGLTHIERGIRVVEYNKLSQSIPKRVVVEGIEIGFKYSGQPATCLKCHATDHVVKNCPKRRKNPFGVREGAPNVPPPPPHNPANVEARPRVDEPPPTAEHDSPAGTPELFTQPPASPVVSLEAPDAEMQTSNSKKRDRPLSSGDEEVGAEPAKKAVISIPDASPAAATEPNTVSVRPPPGLSAAADENTSPPSAASAEKSTDKPDHPIDHRLKHFMSAMTNTGWERSALMRKIPPTTFYRCRALHLQHKYGNYSKSAGKKGQASDNEVEVWKTLAGIVEQDAFLELLTLYQELKAKHDFFKPA